MCKDQDCSHSTYAKLHEGCNAGGEPVESKEALFASYQAALKARYPTNELVFAVADEVADIWRKP